MLFTKLSEVFQVFDDIVDHKVLRLRQIRYGVDSVLPYAIIWNGFGVLLIVIGAVLYKHARRDTAPVKKPA